MARGEDKRDTFMADIGRYVHEVVDAIRAAAPIARRAAAGCQRRQR